MSYDNLGQAQNNYGANEAAAPRLPLREEMAKISDRVSGIHGLLDDLEDRVYGPHPRPKDETGPIAATRGMTDHSSSILNGVNALSDRLQKLLSAL